MFARLFAASRTFSTRFRGAAFSLLAGVALASGASTGAWADDEMTFESVDVGGQKAISAVGQITDQTPQRFIAFLAQNGQRLSQPTIYLDSPGGTVTASMQFGTLMRKVGATTVVGHASWGLFNSSADKAQCFSACVYALMGGRRRVIPPQSEVGIHRMYLTIDGQGDITRFASEADRSKAGGIRAALSSYAGRMGVSPELIAHAEHIRSDDFHILTRAEIAKWRLGVPNL